MSRLTDREHIEQYLALPVLADTSRLVQNPVREGKLQADVSNSLFDGKLQAHRQCGQHAAAC
jgi:hypothetical protein